MSIHLGDTAPDFTADTTDGKISFHDWKAGSWAVLFSHPTDYTPVCTTDLGRTAALEDEFAKRNTKVIALSFDPIEDHHGWAPDIGEVSGTPLDFPIIADADKRVSELYDMIHAGEGDTSTVRSVFVIDPENKVRLTLTYPKSVGRNFDELVRVVDTLQATDAHPIATPVDWRPGERVIGSPSMSTEDARTKLENVEEIKPYLRYASDPPETNRFARTDLVSEPTTGRPGARRPMRRAPVAFGTRSTDPLGLVRLGRWRCWPSR